MAPNRSVGIQSIALVNEVFSGVADPALPCLGALCKWSSA